MLNFQNIWRFNTVYFFFGGSDTVLVVSGVRVPHVLFFSKNNKVMRLEFLLTPSHKQESLYPKVKTSLLILYNLLCELVSFQKRRARTRKEPNPEDQRTRKEPNPEDQRTRKVS